MKTLMLCWATALLGLGAGAPAVQAQSTRALTAANRPKPRPVPVAESEPRSLLDADRPSPLRQDYSPSGMFSQAHGDFMARQDRYQPMIKGSFRWMPGAQLDEEPGDFDLYHYNADAKIPFALDPDTVLILGGKFEARQYDLQRMRGTRDDVLYSAGAHLGLGHFFHEHLYAEAVFSPGAYSDFDGTLHTEDWKFFGRALLTWRLNDQLFVKVGAEHTQVFDEIPAYPLLGISWLINDQWRFDLLAPRRADLSFQIADPTAIFVGIELNGDEYHQRSSLTNGKREFDAQIQELSLYGGANHRFSDFLSVFGRAGLTLAGDHRLNADNGSLVEGQLDPTFMLEAGIGIDF